MPELSSWSWRAWHVGEETGRATTGAIRQLRRGSKNKAETAYHEAGYAAVTHFMGVTSRERHCRKRRELGTLHHVLADE